MSTFGATLKDILAVHRLPYAKAAELADYDHSYVSRLVSGSRTPSREFIDRLVLHCGFSDDEWRQLLVAAGFMPRDAAASLLDPDLVAAADALNDESIPLAHRQSLRRQISALVGITRQMAA